MDQQLAEKLTLICESIQRSLEVDSVLLSIPGANGLSSIVSDSDASTESFADPTMGSETPYGRPDPVFVEEDVSLNAESSEYLLTLGYSDIRFYAELAVQGAKRPDCPGANHGRPTSAIWPYPANDVPSTRASNQTSHGGPPYNRSTIH